MKKIKLFLEKAWKFVNSKIFIIGLIILLIMVLAGQCKRIIDQNQSIDQSEQNISALTDSLQFERDKNGALLVSIDGYIATETELKRLNENLWKEVNEQKGKVLSLNSVILQLKQDSIMLASTIDNLNKIIGSLTQINDSTYSASWTLPYKYGNDTLNYDVFKGTTLISVVSRNPLVLRHEDTFMTNRLTQIELVWGQKVEKDKLRVFVKSDYPGFTVKSLEGVLIDPNDWPNIFQPSKKHWFTGFSVGLGATTGFNIVDGKYGLVIGPTFQWTIYQS
jgi:hypothetical protein